MDEICFQLADEYGQPYNSASVGTVPRIPGLTISRFRREVKQQITNELADVGETYLSVYKNIDDFLDISVQPIDIMSLVTNDMGASAAGALILGVRSDRRKLILRKVRESVSGVHADELFRILVSNYFEIPQELLDILHKSTVNVLKTDYFDTDQPKGMQLLKHIPVTSPLLEKLQRLLFSNIGFVTKSQCDSLFLLNARRARRLDFGDLALNNIQSDTCVSGISVDVTTLPEHAKKLFNRLTQRYAIRATPSDSADIIGQWDKFRNQYQNNIHDYFLLTEDESCPLAESQTSEKIAGHIMHAFLTVHDAVRKAGPDVTELFLDANHLSHIVDTPLLYKGKNDCYHRNISLGHRWFIAVGERLYGYSPVADAVYAYKVAIYYFVMFILEHKRNAKSANEADIMDEIKNAFACLIAFRIAEKVMTPEKYRSLVIPSMCVKGFEFSLFLFFFDGSSSYRYERVLTLDSSKPEDRLRLLQIMYNMTDFDIELPSDKSDKWSFLNTCLDHRLDDLQDFCEYDSTNDDMDESDNESSFIML